MDQRIEEAEARANELIMSLQPQQTDQDAPPVEAAPIEQSLESSEVPAADVVEDGLPSYMQQHESPVQVTPAAGGDWEHKYKVLQGMYRSEVTQVKAENARLNGLLAHQNGIVAGLREEIEAAKSQAPAQGRDGGSSTLDDLSKFDEFGPEIKELAAHSAELARRNDALAQQLADMRAQFQPMQDKVKTISDLDFDGHMDTYVPDWRKQDQDPNFINWLRGLTPETGRPLQESLTEAYEARDAMRVAGIFNKYRDFLALDFMRRQGAAPKPSAPVAQRPMPTPAPPSRGGMQSGQPAGKQYTVHDFALLQDEARRGLWNDRPEEFRRLEAEIFASIQPKR